MVAASSAAMDRDVVPVHQRNSRRHSICAPRGSLSVGENMHWGHDLSGELTCGLVVEGAGSQ